jgi:hypothetical protein
MDGGNADFAGAKICPSLPGLLIFSIAKAQRNTSKGRFVDVVPLVSGLSNITLSRSFFEELH